MEDENEMATSYDYVRNMIDQIITPTLLSTSEIITTATQRRKLRIPKPIPYGEYRTKGKFKARQPMFTDIQPPPADLRDELTICVSGVAGSGKSHMMFLLHEFLREQGFAIQLEQVSDNQSVAAFRDRINTRQFGANIERMKQNKTIKIKEAQLNRPLIRLPR